MSGNARASTVQSAPTGDTMAGAPFSAAFAAELRSLIAKLDRNQRLWLSGYLAGLESAPGAAQAAVVAVAPDAGRTPVTVLFGSQTGNSERLAKQIADRLAERGVRFSVLDMLQCSKTHLQEAETLLVIVSTQGDGDPPERAVPLAELLAGRKAPRLDHVRYSVLALGDTSYEKFCEAGRLFDARLEALGAQRLFPRGECDVDFEAPASQWIDGVLGKLDESLGTPVLRVHGEPPAERRSSASVSNAYTRKNPFHAAVLANQRLTASPSSKDVRHIELSLEGSGIHYEPGDSLGIVPRNAAADVQALLERLPFRAEDPVSPEARSMISLREALTQRCEIGSITRPLLRRYAEATQCAALGEIAASTDAEFARYARGRHVIDLVTEHPANGLDTSQFVRLLPPLAPRLYSIASSQRDAPDEAHLTVSIVRYETLGRARRGVVSGALADLEPGEATVPVYLHRNTAFRLPDPHTPIVMIGPGTGVAPFRAFLAERSQTGASGPNWLFFGDRSFEWDFLYQCEWLELRKRAMLTRMDVAFSRDQPQKLYVQHRLIERGAELWSWLEDGAYLYVCGDAKHMAGDVHDALIGIICAHGGRSDDAAAEYLLQMQQERRYQRDVY